MLVHDLWGGKRYVPHHMVTIKDLLRLLVEEKWRKHSTKVAATLAFNNIDFPKGIVADGGSPVRPVLQGFHGRPRVSLCLGRGAFLVPAAGGSTRLPAI